MEIENSKSPEVLLSSPLPVALVEIVDADLQEASERQQAYLAKQKQEPTTVTPLGRWELKTFGQKFG